MTDKWLKNGNPRDISRSEIAYEVNFGGFQLVDACVNLLRLKSFNNMFGTIFQASPKVRMGNELIRPFWTP